VNVHNACIYVYFSVCEKHITASIYSMGWMCLVHVCTFSLYVAAQHNLHLICKHIIYLFIFLKKLTACFNKASSYVSWQSTAGKLQRGQLHFSLWPAEGGLSCVGKQEVIFVGAFKLFLLDKWVCYLFTLKNIAF